jgi:hypothetical protein
MRYQSPPRDEQGFVLEAPVQFPALVYVNPGEVEVRDSMQHVWDIFRMFDLMSYRDGNKF